MTPTLWKRKLRLGGCHLLCDASETGGTENGQKEGFSAIFCGAV